MNQYFTQVDDGIHRPENNDKFEEVSCENVMFVNLIDEDKTREIILVLKQNSASVNDGIIVKNLNAPNEDLVGILVSLANNVINTWMFPEELKVRRILPIF